MSKVTIVFAHHRNELTPLFNLCLRSLENQDVDKEVIVMDSRPTKTPFPDWVKHVEIDHSVIAPRAFNQGFKMAAPDSTHFLVCNDDLVFAKDALKELMDSIQGYHIIMNAFSNCDIGYYYFADIYLKNKEGREVKMRNQMEFKECLGFEDELMNYPLQKRIILPVQYVCFYATLIPRAIWEALGGLEERYVSGPDDRDFCLSAQKIGVKSMINLAPTIWHFSGRTMALKDPETVAKNRAHNNEIFKSKWGYYP